MAVMDLKQTRANTLDTKQSAQSQSQSTQAFCSEAYVKR